MTKAAAEKKRAAREFAGDDKGRRNLNEAQLEWTIGARGRKPPKKVLRRVADVFNVWLAAHLAELTGSGRPFARDVGRVAAETVRIERLTSSAASCYRRCP